MKYYKMIMYGDGEEFSTNEKIIDEENFKIYQNAIKEGNEMIVFQNSVEKISSIKSIRPMENEELKTMRDIGIEINGKQISEGDIKQIKKTTPSGQRESIKDYISRTHDDFIKKMGWVERADQNGDKHIKINKDQKKIDKFDQEMEEAEKLNK